MATSYYYEVRAVNAAGSGPASAEATVMTPVVPMTLTMNEDVGTTAAGELENYSPSNFTYTLAGGGGDIGGSADSCRFDAAWLAGNGSIIVNVTSVQDTAAAAKAGVMFRLSTAANAAMVCLAVTPGDGLLLESRSSTGGATTTSPFRASRRPYGWN